MDAADVSIVAGWHDALNSADVDRLAALSSADIKLVGPRGVAEGEQILREWAVRAGLRLHMRRLFARADRAVAEERAEWRAAESEQVTGSQDVATIFRVANGRVSYVDRRPDLQDALQSAGLSKADEVELS